MNEKKFEKKKGYHRVTEEDFKRAKELLNLGISEKTTAQILNRSVGLLYKINSATSFSDYRIKYRLRDKTVLERTTENYRGISSAISGVQNSLEFETGYDEVVFWLKKIAELLEEQNAGD